MDFDVSKLSAVEVRDMLLDSYDVDEQELEDMDLNEEEELELLQKKIEEFGPPEEEGVGVDLDEFEEVVDEGGESVEGESFDPEMGDPEWTDHVLSLLDKDEMINGSPTVDGLRRITELVIGRIVSSKTIIHQVPTPENQYRASVVVSLCVSEDVTRELLEVDGAADVCMQNCDSPYYKYPVATAETRAEGRALRRLLRLKKVVAAEEVSKNAYEPEVNLINDDSLINETQIRFLEILSQRLDINLKKLVQKDYPEVHNIKELPYLDSKKLQEKINGFQTVAPPEDIVGYDKTWRAEFC